MSSDRREHSSSSNDDEVVTSAALSYYHTHQEYPIAVILSSERPWILSRYEVYFTHYVHVTPRVSFTMDSMTDPFSQARVRFQHVRIPLLKSDEPLLFADSVRKDLVCLGMGQVLEILSTPHLRNLLRHFSTHEHLQECLARATQETSDDYQQYLQDKESRPR